VVATLGKKEGVRAGGVRNARWRKSEGASSKRGWGGGGEESKWESPGSSQRKGGLYLKGGQIRKESKKGETKPSRNGELLNIFELANLKPRGEKKLHWVTYLHIRQKDFVDASDINTIGLTIRFFKERRNYWKETCPTYFNLRDREGKSG